jgi:membrane-associated phospholipid phosphatase
VAAQPFSETKNRRCGMKNVWENSWFTIPVLLFFNIGLALSLFVPYGYEILYLNDLRREPFNTFFKFATLLGEVHAYVFFGVAALFWRYRFTVLVALTGLITLPVVHVFKAFFGSDRPITFLKNLGLADAVVTVPGVVLNVGQTSLPSGHTMAAFALFGLLAMMLERKQQHWGLLFAALAAVTGVSRVFLVQHFLIDILVGAALGLAVSWFVLWLGKMPFFQKRKWLEKSLTIEKEGIKR